MAKEIIDTFAALLNAEKAASLALPPALARPGAAERLARLALHHGLGARLSRVFNIKNIENFSPPARARLTQAGLRVAQLHGLAAAHLPAWMDDLKASGVPCIVLKGWGLAQRLYPVPADRDFSDFDLVFPPECRALVTRYFRERGFSETVKPQGKWAPNRDKLELRWDLNPWVEVECHFGLGYGRFGLRGFWERLERTAVPVPGRSKPWLLPHLGPEDELLYLVYHAGVQHRFQKLFWLQDLLLLERRHPALFDREGKAWRRGEQLGLLPALTLASVLIREVSGTGTQRGTRAVFHDLILGRCERSFLLRARLRARLQGGWLALTRYGAERALAQARLRWYG